MEKKELELYVHIPFCVRKCTYCDFLSAPAGEQEKASYVEALIREIKSKRQTYAQYRVSTVFLGGGTPSVLSGECTARIFHALRENFDIDRSAEVTMEVNPGTVTEEKAAVWKQCGVNRLSIGLQSADDRELAMLGRIHTYRDFLDTWHIVRLAGFENINIDLISAIPGQTAGGWERTLRTAAGLGPEHISAYSLIIEEGTPFYARYGENRGIISEETGLWPRLPDEDTEREIYKMTARILAEYGYHRYEISNYAKKGYECRHNLGYWDRKEYLGLGLGSASLIRERRFHNTAVMETYLTTAGKLPEVPACEDLEILTTEDQMEEFMFLGLRKTEGICCDRFQEKFGRPIEEVYGQQILELERKGLLKRENRKIRLTERGVDVSNTVFTEFMF